MIDKANRERFMSTIANKTEIQQFLKKSYPEDNSTNYIFRSDCGRFKYKIGVIDFLTDYGTMKKVETTYKAMMHWGKRAEVSCVDPVSYQDRFMQYMKDNL